MNPSTKCFVSTQLVILDLQLEHISLTTNVNVSEIATVRNSAVGAVLLHDRGNTFSDESTR